MKNTLRFFLIIIFLLSGVNSFANKKTDDSFVCPTTSISYANTSMCTSDISIHPVILTGTGNYLGGTFSSTNGIVINPTTGEISPNVSAAGTYTITYTIPPGSGCPSVTASITVSINDQPFAGTDSQYSICGDSTTPIDLYSMIAGEDTGGTWTRTSGTGGTFNSAGGIFTPAVGTTTSTFEYTIIGPSSCGNDTCIVTINFNAFPTNITITGSTTICAGNSANLTFTGTPGTNITWEASGIQSTFVIGASASITILVSPTVTTTYSLLSASLNGCNIPLTQSATVAVNAIPQFITQIPDITICNGGTLNIASQLTSTVPGTTFIWSATSVNVNIGTISGDETNINQVVNLINTFQTGILNIIVTPKLGNCTGISQQIVITVKPIPGTPIGLPTMEICSNEYINFIVSTYPNIAGTILERTITDSQNVTGFSNGTGLSPFITNDLLVNTSNVQGFVKYSVTSKLGNCYGNTTNYIVLVNPSPNTGSNGNISVSEASTTPIDLFSIITGEESGGIWTRISGTGGTFDAGTGTFTPEVGATNSNFIYDLTFNTGCNSYSIATVNIDVVPVGIANTYNQTISNGNFSNIMLSSSNVPGSNFIWTFTTNNISGASNGSGNTISQQLSLIDPNLDGYVDYTITPVNNSANGNSFTARVGIQSLLGSETFTTNTIKLSPNPVTDILNIENEYQINSIKVYNQLGQMVFGKEINNNSTQLDLSVINSGIYNVLIETEKGTINHKIVKK